MIIWIFYFQNKDKNAYSVSLMSTFQLKFSEGILLLTATVFYFIKVYKAIYDRTEKLLSYELNSVSF